MGENITECENHFLYNCDLNSAQRQKSSQRINNILGTTHSKIDFMNTLQGHTQNVRTRQHPVNDPQRDSTNANHVIAIKIV